MADICPRCRGHKTVLVNLNHVGFGDGFRQFMSAGTRTIYNDDGSVHHQIVCPACDGSGIKEGEVHDVIPV